jgi:hypothetical protein
VPLELDPSWEPESVVVVPELVLVVLVSVDPDPLVVVGTVSVGAPGCDGYVG